MGEDNSFQVERKFWDDAHFPYGFSRSGDFTLEQAALMEAHGHAYVALSSGERKPITKMEEHFVAFCKGDKEATNSHEKAWSRYSEKINCPKRRYSLTATVSKDVPIAESELEDD